MVSMKKILLLAFSLIACSQLAAENNTWFLTAATGQSRYAAQYVSRYTNPIMNSVPGANLDSHNFYWSVGAGYAFVDLARFTAGYEDWGRSTGAASVGQLGIFPLTASAKGVYCSYSPILKLGFGLALEPEIGFLISDTYLGTNFASTYGISDANVRSRESLQQRYGLGLSWRLLSQLSVGVKYLQIDFPSAGFKPGASFFLTNTIRPSTVAVTAQLSF
jgi:opacity protein-like surface antigen